MRKIKHDQRLKIKAIAWPSPAKTILLSNPSEIPTRTWMTHNARSSRTNSLNNWGPTPRNEKDCSSLRIPRKDLEAHGYNRPVNAARTSTVAIPTRHPPIQRCAEQHVTRKRARATTPNLRGGLLNTRRSRSTGTVLLQRMRLTVILLSKNLASKLSVGTLKVIRQERLSACWFHSVAPMKTNRKACAAVKSDTPVAVHEHNGRGRLRDRATRLPTYRTVTGLGASELQTCKRRCGTCPCVCANITTDGWLRAGKMSRSPEWGVDTPPCINMCTLNLGAHVARRGPTVVQQMARVAQSNLI